jgi:hypothetical protein
MGAKEFSGAQRLPGAPFGFLFFGAIVVARLSQ